MVFSTPEQKVTNRPISTMPDSPSASSRDSSSRETTPGDPLRRAASAAPSRAPGWVLSAALILLAAGSYFFFRQPLDEHLPRLEKRQAPAAVAPATQEEAPTPEVAPEPVARIWTFQEMESALEPLPEQTAALITAGREELSGFTDLDSDDEARRLRARSQWESWGRIWRNRVRAIRDQIPPMDQCGRHAALEPICDTLAAALQHLARVPLAGNAEEAAASLDLAEVVLFPPEEDEEIDEGEVVTEEAAAEGEGQDVDPG